MHTSTISPPTPGKLAIFKAIVIGDPQPEVTWSRANGEITDKEKFQNKYDDVSHEHTLEVNTDNRKSKG